MNKFKLTVYTLAALFAGIALLWPGTAQGVRMDDQDRHSTALAAHQPVVQQLVDLVAANSAFSTELEAALLEQGADSWWHGKTLDDLYAFFDEWLVFLPTIDNARLYMDRFYEFADDGLGRQLAARNPLRGWLYRFMLAVGEFNDSPASAAAVPAWTGDPRINMDDYVVPRGGYRSFNEFFTRRIKPGVRPIDLPDDPSVFVSPADSTLMNIADSLTSADTIGVKGENLNIHELLGGSPLADRFINGRAVLCVLNTTDYHRYHAPVPARIAAQRQMAGLYYGMDGVWLEYFFQHRRGYHILETGRFGYVGMACVGMFTISSVNFIRDTGERVNKGDELGNFAYGGSAIILLFEPGAAEFTVPLGRPLHVKMGQQIARALRPEAVVPAVMSTQPSSSAVVATPALPPPVLLPNILVQDAAVSAVSVKPGEQVTVTANVANRSAVSGTARITLFVNGLQEAATGITLEGGSITPVSFTVRRDQPGVYSVYVNRTQAGSVKVEEDGGADFILAGSVLLVLIAVALGGLRLWQG